MTQKFLKMPKRLLLKSRKLFGGVSVKERQIFQGDCSFTRGSGKNSCLDLGAIFPKIIFD